MRIFYANVHKKVTQAELEDLFGEFGEVRYVKLLKNPDGQSRGCGFTQMIFNDDAERAIQMLNNSIHLGRRLKVERAKSQDVYRQDTQQNSRWKE